MMRRRKDEKKKRKKKLRHGTGILVLTSERVKKDKGETCKTRRRRLEERG